MARRRKAPLVPAAKEALAGLKNKLEQEIPAPPVDSMIARFKQLAHELVEREKLR
jgi:hypothetical protein